MALNDLFDQNNMLQGLPLFERQLIVPFCDIVELHLGDSIEEAGRSIEFLHFPVDSAISLTNRQDQEHLVEVTVTGKEGCSGASIVLGDDRSPCLAMVQIPGVAIRLATAKVMNRLQSLPYLHAAFARYDLLIMNLAVISVGCSQFHSPGERLARWLKAHWQRTGIQSFPFSTDLLALQVGVNSTIVKACLAKLQAEGIVDVGRNTVVITDQDGLEREACRCYTLARESVDEYIEALAHLSRIHSRSRT